MGIKNWKKFDIFFLAQKIPTKIEKNIEQQIAQNSTKFFDTEKNRTKINCLEKCFDNKTTNDL